MKTFISIIVSFCFLSSSSVFAQLLVKDNDTPPNTLLQVWDEGTAGSIIFYDAGTPASTFAKLYRSGKSLFWNGSKLGTVGSTGWTDDGSVVRLTSSTDKVGIGTTSPTGALHVTGNDGVIFGGTFGSGTALNLGSGARLMWYPKKAAFRSGAVNSNQWDDANIGNYSIAVGNNTTASGEKSLSIGDGTTATGINSIAMGHWCNASGNYAVAMGDEAFASDYNSVAIGNDTEAMGNSSTAFGYKTNAYGTASTALGEETTASGMSSTALGSFANATGDYTTAIGSRVKVEGEGSCIIGDNSATSLLTKTTLNRFYGRFSNGYYLYTNSTASIGVYVSTSGNSWSSISDSTKKENFKTVKGEEVLSKISKFRLGSWNYIGQDPKEFRHYGPMAQDFYSAFGNDGIGTIGCDTLLASADFDGINLIAIKALERRTKQHQETINELEDKISQLEKIIDLISQKSEKRSKLSIR